MNTLKLLAGITCLVLANPVVTAGCAVSQPVVAQGQVSPDQALDGVALDGMEWRCVGPFMGNRGTSVEAHPTKKNVFLA